MNRKTKFRCHHCYKSLSNEKGINLRVINSHGKTQIVSLSLELGNYSLIESEFPIIDGEKLICCCYHCNKDLVSKSKPDLCYVLLGDNDIVYFSPIKGVKATFIEGIDKVIPYGADAKIYYSYFENVDEEHARIMGGKYCNPSFI